MAFYRDSNSHRLTQVVGYTCLVYIFPISRIEHMSINSGIFEVSASVTAILKATGTFHGPDENSSGDISSSELPLKTTSAYSSPNAGISKDSVKSNFDSLRKLLEKSPNQSVDSVKSPELRNGPVLPTAMQPQTPKAVPVSSCGGTRTTRRAPTDELDRSCTLHCPYPFTKLIMFGLVAGGGRRWRR